MACDGRAVRAQVTKAIEEPLRSIDIGLAHVFSAPLRRLSCLMAHAA